jgi:hypothetical protein
MDFNIYNLEITPFNGTVLFLKEKEPLDFTNQLDVDKYMYGMCAVDETGNRVDPATIRQRIDGSYVMVKIHRRCDLSTGEYRVNTRI